MGGVCRGEERTTRRRSCGAVADKQDAHGKGEVEIPAREMLADILLESGHPEQALAEYERAMTIDPNRFNELYGAARSAELTKQTAKADKYYAQLVKNCSGSESRASGAGEGEGTVGGEDGGGGVGVAPRRKDPALAKGRLERGTLRDASLRITPVNRRESEVLEAKALCLAGWNGTAEEAAEKSRTCKALAD